jgi:hypothetical protein
MGVGRSLGRAHRAIGCCALLAGGVAFLAGSALPAGASSAKVKAEEAQAKRALLVRSDFPSGWSGHGAVTTNDSNGGSSNFPGGSQLASCLGISQSLLNLSTPTADSPTFQPKTALLTIQDSATIFPSKKVARQAAAVFTGSKVPSCMTTAFQGPAKASIADAMGYGITVGTITATLADPALLIRHATGFTLSFPATYQGVTLDTQVNFISIFRGTTDNQLTIFSVRTPISPSLARHLTTVAYEKE